MLNSVFHQESVNSKTTNRGYLFFCLVLFGRISVRQILISILSVEGKSLTGNRHRAVRGSSKCEHSPSCEPKKLPQKTMLVIAKLKHLYLSWSSFFSMSHMTCKAITSWAVWFIFGSTCCSVWSFRTGLPRGMDSLSCTQEFRREQLTRIDPESLICSAFSSDKSLKRNQERANVQSTIFISWFTSEACNHASGRAGRQGDFFAGDKLFIWHLGTRNILTAEQWLYQVAKRGVYFLLRYKK